MPPAEPGKWILFRTEGTLFGARLEDVLKLVSGEHMTFIPRADEKVKGAILYQGKAVPVFKMGDDNGHTAPDGENMVLLMEHELGPVGVAVDKVIGVVDQDDLAPGEEEGAVNYGGETVIRVSPERTVSPIVPDD